MPLIQIDLDEAQDEYIMWLGKQMDFSKRDTIKYIINFVMKQHREAAANNG